jgi:magnesium transporter
MGTGRSRRKKGRRSAGLRKKLFPTAKKPGAAPGTLVYAGKAPEEPVNLSLARYDAEVLEERSDVSLDECLSDREKPGVLWINATGLADIQMVERLGAGFGLHRLVLEDILHTTQRPKVEDFSDHLYVVVHMLQWDAASMRVSDEQVSLVLGSRYVLSFQERAGDVFEPVRERLRSGRGLIRSCGADYLAYALIDAVVDHYFAILEHIGDALESLEERVLADPSDAVVSEIHRLRHELVLLRRSVWPLREVLSELYRGDATLITDRTRIFLRDVQDHAVQIIDTVETMRDVVGGLMDLYMTGVSNRMNEVMKVLTMIATVFIPLSFLAGLYGMNFDVMPELHVPWAYPVLLGVMATVGLGMLVFFRRKGWL